MQRIPFGPLELVEPLGRGGMAAVWRARHRASGQVVAVKILQGPRARTPEFLAAFRQEVAAVARLRHAGIIGVLDAGRIPESWHARAPDHLPDGSPYLVMELVEGGTLAGQEGRVSWTRLAAVLRQLLQALAHAHAHAILHRDLKPSNVLVEQPTGRAVLTDFGVARVDAGSQDLDHAEWLLGTPAFMAPEQIAGAWREEGPWTDLFGLGCLVWSLVYGSPPYGRTLEEVRAAQPRGLPRPPRPLQPVPGGFAEWCARLVEPCIEERFPDAATAERALGALQGRPASTAPVPDARVALAPPPPRPRLPGLGVGMVRLRSSEPGGHGAERVALWNALRRTLGRRHPQAVVLAGEKGVGCTHLATWCGRRASELGVARLLAACYAPEDEPGTAISRMLETFFAAEGLEGAARARQVAARLARLPQPHTPLDPHAVAALMRPRAGGEDTTTVRVAGHRERGVLIEQLLEALAAQLPIVLLLDDAHLDREALELARRLLEREEPLPVLVLLTVGAPTPEAHREPLAALLAHPRAERLEVSPLSDREMQRLLREAMPLSPAFAAEVASRAEGLVGLAFRMLEHWADEGRLVARVAGIEALDPTDLPMPPSIAELAARRVAQAFEGAPDEAMQAIEIAAALGRLVPEPEWAQACRTAGVDLDGGGGRDLRDRLVEADLARQHAGGAAVGWSFASPAVRAAIEAGARARGRATRWHRAWASILAPARDPAGLERRARHLLAAEEKEAALQPLAEAAAGWLAQGETALAKAALDRRKELLLEAGVTQDDARWGMDWVLRSRLALAEGEARTAEQWASRAYQAAWDHRWSRVLAQANLQLGRLLVRRGEMERAGRHLEAGLRIAERVRDRRLLAEALLASGTWLSDGGRLEEAARALGRAVRLHRALGDLDALARSMRARAHVERRAGRPAEARRGLDAALRAFRSTGNRAAMAEVLAELADLDRSQGKTDAARAALARSLRILRELERPTEAVELDLAMVALDTGAGDEARRALDDLARRLEHHHDDGQAARVALARMVLAAREGDAVAWERSMEEAAHRLGRSGYLDARIAELAAEAADRAEARWGAAVARPVWHLARDQWRRLGHKEAAASVTRRLQGGAGA